MQGTNHNFYSTEWQTSDSSGCLNHDALWPSPNGAHSGDCPECREPALYATMALFRGVLGDGEEQLLSLFDPRYTIPGDLTTIEAGKLRNYCWDLGRILPRLPAIVVRQG